MFTKPRRRKSSIFSDSRYGSRYSRRRHKIPTPVLLAAIPMALLVLELLLRIGVGLAGKGDEMNAYQGEPAIATAYRFKPLTASQAPVRGIPGYGGLAVKSSPITGYQLVPGQENAALKI
ncbi:MAG: hypothetical protein HC805_03085 [Alkalinema sp. RL_2_19]|nr:hypothetical protein [Alkalinema sp. RL_2_19]